MHCCCQQEGSLVFRPQNVSAWRTAGEWGALSSANMRVVGMCDPFYAETAQTIVLLVARRSVSGVNRACVLICIFV